MIMKGFLRIDLAVKILLTVALAVIAIGFMKYKYRKEIETELLIKEFSKRLYQKEFDTRNQIYKVEQRISTVETNDSLTQQKIKTTESNYKIIIRNLKKLDNEKITTDNEIINASDSSDWNWFTIRFPKHNN